MANTVHKCLSSGKSLSLLCTRYHSPIYAAASEPGGTDALPVVAGTQARVAHDVVVVHHLPARVYPVSARAVAQNDTIYLKLVSLK